MKKTSIKFVSLFVSVIMAITVLPFVVSAENETQFLDCDSFYQEVNFVNNGAESPINHLMKYEGTGCYEFANLTLLEKKQPGFQRKNFLLNIPSQSLSSASLKVWLYVGSAYIGKDRRGNSIDGNLLDLNIELTSSGVSDVNEYQWVIKDENITVDAWTQYTLNFSSAAVSGSPDSTKLNFMRVYANTCGTTVFYMDDFTVSAADVTYTENLSYKNEIQLLGSETKESGNWVARGTDLTINNDDVYRGSASYDLWANRGETSTTMHTAYNSDVLNLNLANTSKFSLNFYAKISDVSAIKTMVVELSSGGTYAEGACRWEIPYSRYSDKKDEWTELWVDFSMPHGYTGDNSFDPTNINFFRFYYNKEASSEVHVLIDDIRLISYSEANIMNYRSTKNILNCEYKIDDLTETGNDSALLLNNNLSATGSSCYGFTCDRPSTEAGHTHFVELICGNIGNPFKISIPEDKVSQSALTIWLYVPSGSSVNSFYVELGSADRSDVAEYQWGISSSSMAFDRWKQYTLNFSSAGKEGTPDCTNLRYFRLFAGFEGGGSRSSIYVDDLSLVGPGEIYKNFVYVDEYRLLGSDATSESNYWLVSGKPATFETGTVRRGTSSVLLNPAKADTSCTFYPADSDVFKLHINKQRYNLSFKFKMRSTNPSAITHMAFELSSSGTWDKQEREWAINSNVYKSASNWTEVTVNYTDTYVPGSSISLPEINFMRLYFIKEADVDCTVYIDDLRVLSYGAGYGKIDDPNTFTYGGADIFYTGDSGTVYSYNDTCKEYLEADLGIDVSKIKIDYSKMKSQNKAIRLSWTNTMEWSNGYNGIKNYIIKYGKSKNGENGFKVVLPADADHYDLYNLEKATSYYVRIIAQMNDGQFIGKTVQLDVTDMGPRVLYVDGTANFRDEGGYVSEVFGGKTLQNKIIRGAQLINGTTSHTYDDVAATEAGLNYLSKELKVKTEIDVRNYGPETRNLTESLIDGANLVYGQFGGYTYLFTQPKSVYTIFSTMADPANYPIYFHCTGGADRTGTIGFALDCILGYSEDVIYRDFEFTTFSKFTYRSAFFDINDVSESFGKMKKMIIENYEGNTLCEKMENVLMSCGITMDQINSIRSIMLGKYVDVKADYSFANDVSSLAYGKNISAKYASETFSSGSTVNGGKKLTLTASGKNSYYYVYNWSNGFVGETLTIDKLLSDTSLTCAVTSFDAGDADDNREINAIDSLMVLRNLVNKYDLDATHKYTCDVDKSGGLSSADALLMLRRSVGLIDIFPCEKK